jgi:hypothetical protein
MRGSLLAASLVSPGVLLVVQQVPVLFRQLLSGPVHRLFDRLGQPFDDFLRPQLFQLAYRVDAQKGKDLAGVKILFEEQSLASSSPKPALW